MKRDALRLAKDVITSRRKRADGGTDEWQSTGKLVRDDKSINWGDSESAADFFRADKEQRLRDEAKLVDRAEPAPAPKRTAEGRQMAPARVVPARSEEPAVEAPLPVPAPAPVRTAEGRQMAPDWEYQEPLNDEQRKALALQQWTASGQKGTPDAPVRDMMAIKAPSVAQSVAPELPRQALSFGPMQSAPAPAPAPAPVAGQNQADQVWQRMIIQESGNRQFDRSGRPITSKAGALGMAQVMPGTGPEAARLAGLPWSLDRLRNDPEYNHALGRAYYDEQLRQFGSPVIAAAAYNGGPGRVTKALQLAARTNRPFTDFLKPETRDYVRIVASPSSRRPPLRFGSPEGYADGGRTGYANEGAVDDGAVYDAMGNVAVPAATTDPAAKEGLYDAAMKKVGAAGEAVVDPVANAIKTVSDDYRKNLEHHTQSAFESSEQARKDAAGERGWQGRLLSPFQTANATLGTAFAPISAAATSVGHGATYLTGNPAFGQRAELLAGLVDPSHLGLAKVGAMKLGKIAEDVAPYSAMFLPVARADPALATAKQLLAEGKTADEIKATTGIHFGPESDFGSYELQSNVPDEFGRYRREGVMPLEPESRPMKEISDEGLVLSRDPANDTPLSRNQTIESYTFEHPELANQFPELAGAYQDIKVHPDFSPEGAFYDHTEIAPGQFGPKLEIRAPSVEEARSVAAHEIQHFVAEKGGLEQGANPENYDLIDFHRSVFDEAKSEIAKAQGEMAAFAEPAVEKYKEYYKIDPNSDMGVWELNHIRHEAETQWLQNLKKTEPERAKEIERAMYIQQRVDTPYKMYQHMYGEALARTTQDRLDIPKAERDQAPVRFNYNQYQGKGQPEILTPIPEENLFSNKNMSDYRREIENIRQQLDEPWWKEPFASTPSASSTSAPIVQEISSAGTSINQIPSLLKSKVYDLPEGSRNIDIGGGKYDRGTDYFKSERGIESKVYDPFNRTPEHNQSVLEEFRANPADSATVANVLNVIKEPEARAQVIQSAYDNIRPNGKAFFDVYEGDRSGQGKQTTKGWQNNQKAEDFLAEVKSIFPNAYRKGTVIVAEKAKSKFKNGGAVDENVKKEDALIRAMDISRFGTDAVQSAVNLARQHRGRPDS